MPQQDLMNRIVNRVNDFNRRVRDLEEQVRNINARVNTLDDTVLEKTKDLSGDIQELEDEIEEIRDRMANMEVDIKDLNRERRKYVSKQEIEEIENYMELMNPIKSSFMTKKEVKKLMSEREGVTKDEVERMIDRKIKSMEEQTGSNAFGEDKI
ncbi:MAG: hypothetical protein H8Z69_02980 [Nanohaloarchaea archaeon]|nr:hypothetical protein [Candidatus Nanohaloarchaea archaeon]